LGLKNAIRLRAILSWLAFPLKAKDFNFNKFVTKL
jgi:hypothetical protein